jgi:hypothetical protein
MAVLLSTASSTDQVRGFSPSLLSSLLAPGAPVKFHGMDHTRAVQYAGLVSEFTFRTREFLVDESAKSSESSEVPSCELIPSLALPHERSC